MENLFLSPAPPACKEPYQSLLTALPGEGDVVLKPTSRGDCMSLDVLVVTTSFPLTPESPSGAFVRRLVQHLPRQCRVTVLAPCAKDDYREAAPTFRLVCFRYAMKRWQVLAQQPGGIPVALRENRWLYGLLPFFIGSMFARCLVLSFNVDVIHANWSVSGVVSGWAGKLLRKPLITTLRGEDVTRVKKSLLSKWALVTCLWLSDAVVTVSEAMAQTLRSGFPRYANKVHFIPNGVESSLLSLKRSTGSRVDRFRILTIGSLIPRKGIDTIIRSIAEVAEAAEVQLTVIGSGRLEDHLRRLAAELGVAERVEMIGAVAPSQIGHYLNAADVFILASHSEGRPNVVLEAMAAGVPVIATDIDGIRELVRDGRNGLLFHPNDHRGLCRQIRRLLESNDEREKISAAGRRFIVDSGLTWENTGRCYEEIYRRLVKRSF